MNILNSMISYITHTEYHSNGVMSLLTSYDLTCWLGSQSEADTIVLVTYLCSLHVTASQIIRTGLVAHVLQTQSCRGVSQSVIIGRRVSFHPQGSIVTSVTWDNFFPVDIQGQRWEKILPVWDCGKQTERYWCGQMGLFRTVIIIRCFARLVLWCIIFY